MVYAGAFLWGGDALMLSFRLCITPCAFTSFSVYFVMCSGLKNVVLYDVCAPSLGFGERHAKWVLGAVLLMFDRPGGWYDLLRF